MNSESGVREPVIDVDGKPIDQLVKGYVPELLYRGKKEDYKFARFPGTQWNFFHNIEWVSKNEKTTTVSKRHLFYN